MKGCVLEISIMQSPRFCCECGEKLFARRRRGLPGRAFCKECAPTVWRSRFGLIAALALLIAISFAAGRLTASREPFYFIGTPVDLAPAPDRSAENNSLPQPAQQTGAPTQTELSQSELSQTGLTETGSALCGAPTKSGGACRRRVRGGGYCFQHRDKLKPAINR